MTDHDKALWQKIKAAMQAAMQAGASDGATFAQALITYANAEMMPVQLKAFYQALLHAVPAQELRDALEIREKHQPERL